MTRPRRDEPEDPDERETLPANGETDAEPSEDRETRATAPGESRSDTPPTDAFFDLESMPARRATPQPAPSSRPSTPTPPARRRAPDVDPFLDAPLPDEDERATLPQDAATDPGTGQPASSVDVEAEREMPTQVGEFAGSSAGNRPSADEAETIADLKAADATGPQLVAGTARTDASGRSASGRRPASKGPAFTARDPAAGTAAGRGTQPGAPSSSGSQILAEGQLVADRYELIERLGKGGMGEVWKAKHTLLQGMRAIKVIKASISRDPQFRQRFLQEGQTMMRVKHDGVVEVTDLDETRSTRELFMVMEYLQGRTVYDAIRDKESPLQGDVRNAARVLCEMALGVQRIHDERIVHKDLKTDNVLLVKGEDGLEHPKVIDFGLAKRMGDKDGKIDDMGGTPSPQPYQADLRTTLSGTLAYMAPEQFRAEPSSFQSDIYAFGVMAYEVFSGGEFPLPRGSLGEYMERHRKGEVPDAVSTKCPTLDRRLAAIFDQCLAMKREDRPESFAKVAKDIQYWLDTPDREKRRNRMVLTTCGVLALAAGAVWGIFFAGETAPTLSKLKYVVAGTERVETDGVLYLPQTALSTFEVFATIDGKPGQASLEADGVSHAVTAEVKDGTFVARADLSDLSDGAHRMKLRPSPKSSATDFVVDVDRAAPKFRAVSVTGAAVSPAGVFSKAQSPEVVVELDEAGPRIERVSAKPANAPVVEAQRDGDSDRWILKGTSNGDGPVELDLVARDRAGNESRRKFSYVRDTEFPTLTVFDDYTSESGKDVHEIHIRPSASRKVHLVFVDFDHEGHANGTPLVVAAAFAGQQRIEKVMPEGTGDVEFDVPEVPPEGLKTKLSVRDAAGNEMGREFLVAVVPDGVLMTDQDQKAALTIGPKDDATVVMVRDYSVGKFSPGDRIALSSTRVRDAAGARTEGEPATSIAARVVNVQGEQRIVVVRFSAESLGEGTYEIGPAFLPGVPVKPYAFTVDGTQPSIESYAVAEKSGRQVAEGAFALSPDLIVTAVVSDLSIQSVTLGGQRPAEPLEPGRHTYTFSVHCDHEGVNTWPLVVIDGAKNTAQRSVSVQADWSVPTLTLERPASGAETDDRTEMGFEGTCSETDYDVVVEMPGAPAKSSSFTTDKFQFVLVLPPSERLVLSLYARDRAGHESAPVEVALKVVHLATESRPEVTWSHGVTTLMEKVEPGDVVVGGRVHPVSKVFLDRTEVTNRQYRDFLASGKGGHGPWCHADEPKDHDHTPSAETWGNAKWNADDLPVVNVSYWDAFAFAKWSDRRLPTEAEWVKAAAKSKDETDLRKWPPFATGEWKDGVLATSEFVKGPVSALTGADVSPANCLHMGGNVSEWVEVSRTADGASAVGTRGGNWYYTKLAADVRDTPAKLWERGFRYSTIGFRCAVDESRVQP